MEKVVNRMKGRQRGWRKDSLSTNPSHLFLIEFTIECLLNIQNGGSITNAVRHGMHGIHFSTAKRLVRKCFVN